LIHRLVQIVLRDELSHAELIALFDTIIDLCDRAFPTIVINETRQICWKYQNQVLGPLLQIKILPTEKFANSNERIGNFLRDDGKINDSERLLKQAVDAWMMISGMNHFRTLTALDTLALTYQAQGRNVDAAKIQEEVLEKRRMILGEGHPDTLATMHNLTSTYYAQGRNANAAKIQEEVLEKSRNILGEEHFGRGTSRHARHHACACFDISSSREK
jgi:tetratricopeptide (TPR) repeat protein